MKTSLVTSIILTVITVFHSCPVQACKRRCLPTAKNLDNLRITIFLEAIFPFISVEPDPYICSEIGQICYENGRYCCYNEDIFAHYCCSDFFESISWYFIEEK